MSLSLTKNQILAVVGGVVVVTAAGWFGWQYFESTEPAPIAQPKPLPVTAAKPPAEATAATPADAGPARDKVVEDALVTSEKAGSRIGSLASKPAAPAAGPVPSKARADARTCLDLATNEAIMKCAAPYR